MWRALEPKQIVSSTEEPFPCENILVGSDLSDRIPDIVEKV
jgi:hypothetical protein